MKGFLVLFGVLVALAAAAPAAPAESGADDSLAAKTAAIDRLLEAGGEEAARAILPYLKDRDLAVRSHAMRRLVDIGERAVDPLIGALAEEDTRWLASGALINIGNDAVRKTVLALKNGNPAVRRNALFILRQLDARAAAPSIQEALSDPDHGVQVQAIQTIAQFGGEGAQRLVRAKTESIVPAVRDAAIEALPKFGAASIPALSALLDYGKPDDVRVAAIRALGTMGTRESLTYLDKSLADPSPLVRYYATLTLGDTNDPSVLDHLVRLMDDPDPTVREAASDVFGRMPDVAGAQLFRLLKDGNMLQKISAATAIRKARYRPAVPLLLDATRDSERDVKVASVAALMVLADPASVEGLVNGLRDPDIRWLCVLALRQFGDANIRPLLRRTNDPELDYWKHYVLEGMGDRVLEGCLDTLGKEQDIATRISTLCTMRQIKDIRAVYPIIRLLGDERLGYVAGFVLAQMGEIAVEPLLLSTQDDNPAVRARAATALGEIGLDRVMRPLRDLTRDRDPQVRQAAERAIRKIAKEEAAAAQASELCPK
ncbi:MAG: HEAT repeat domain-containing protein [Gemmatimonadota bacterium]